MPSMNTKSDFMNASMDIVTSYVNRNSDVYKETLSRSIEYDLNEDQIKRLVEFVNKALFAYNFEVNEDKTFGFKPVDSAEVIRDKMRHEDSSNTKLNDFTLNVADIPSLTDILTKESKHTLTEEKVAMDYNSLPNNVKELVRVKRREVAPDTGAILLKLGELKQASSSLSSSGMEYQEAVDELAKILRVASQKIPIDQLSSTLTESLTYKTRNKNHISVRMVRDAIRKIWSESSLRNKEASDSINVSIDVLDAILDKTASAFTKGIASYEKMEENRNKVKDMVTSLNTVASAFPQYWEDTIGGEVSWTQGLSW